jgi:hypothetical protein
MLGGPMYSRGNELLKKAMMFLPFLFSVQFFLWSNPIDGTPFAKFSELVFDKNNNWTIEISISSYVGSIDSIVFRISDKEARLNLSYPANRPQIGIITSERLTIPLLIHRDGDKIVIYTYSTNPNSPTTRLVRIDSVIYGNYPGATVGRPVSGYSIMRNSYRYSSNAITIDCITKSPSLGAVNDTLGLSGTLKGRIYDGDNKLVTKLKVLPASPCYFVLETPLSIDSNGAYTTKIFPTLCSPVSLTVRLVDFEGWIDSVEIEPFELMDIRPDTVVVHDIHLKDNRYIVTSIKSEVSRMNDELTLINYPNPFNLSTNFFVKIPDRLKAKAGNITIANLNGQLVRSIPIKESGSVSWDGRDDGGTIMPSGIYLYKLIIDKQVLKTGSMILLK